MTALRVLICDDEPLALARLARLLSKMADVDVVGRTTDSREVMMLVEMHAPDLLVLDVEMPTMDGFAVIEHIRDRLVLNRLPMIAFVTAHTNFADRAAEVGSMGFLTKPVHAAHLKAVIDSARTAKAVFEVPAI